MKRKFTYRGIHRMKVIISQISGFVAFIIGTSMVGLTLFGLTTIPNKTNEPFLNDPRITLICLAIWILIVSWTISILLLNFYPTIWIDNDGIDISFFLFFGIHISWYDIIDLKPIKLWKLVIIRVKRLTVFHRFYSWIYLRSFRPGFFIDKTIENYEILISEINLRARDQEN